MQQREAVNVLKRLMEASVARAQRYSILLHELLEKIELGAARATVARIMA